MLQFYGERSDTKWVYEDAEGRELSIENSLPRGGLSYTAPNGQEFVYAVFWNRISNETDSPYEIELDFHEKKYELVSSPGRFFTIHMPPDTMTAQGEHEFNYGLDIEPYLDAHRQDPAGLRKTIRAGDTTGFYIVLLFNTWVDGPLRTGLRIVGQDIFYSVHDMDILCGKIRVKSPAPSGGSQKE